MDTSKHTPTPWAFEPDHSKRDGSQFIFSDADRDTWVATAENRETNGAEASANAAFIVRACNSHDALVAALREIAAMNGTYCGVAVETARAALAAAESQP